MGRNVCVVDGNKVGRKKKYPNNFIPDGRKKLLNVQMIVYEKDLTLSSVENGKGKILIKCEMVR